MSRKNKSLISVILAAVLVIASAFVMSGCKDETPEKITAEANLYFTSESGMELVPEKRVFELSEESELPMAVVSALCEGPQTEGLKPTLHKDTVIKGITVKEELATVEISEGFATLNSGGTLKEFNAVYSVVNSLTELEGISKVVFSENGNIRREFGSFYFEEPLTFKATIND